jgi:hypothetical protein
MSRTNALATATGSSRLCGIPPVLSQLDPRKPGERLSGPQGLLAVHLFRPHAAPWCVVPIDEHAWPSIGVSDLVAAAVRHGFVLD